MSRWMSEADNGSTKRGVIGPEVLPARLFFSRVDILAGIETETWSLNNNNNNIMAAKTQTKAQEENIWTAFESEQERIPISW